MGQPGIRREIAVLPRLPPLLPVPVPVPEVVPVDPLGRAHPASRLAHTRAALAELVASGTWAGDPAVQPLLDRAARLDRPRGTPVLVHGDLHARHLLVDGSGQASGVIDWGDLCLADPAVDLSLGYAAFAGPARESFLSALLARYAAAEGRAPLLDESLRALRRAVR